MTDFTQPQPFVSSRIKRMKRRAFMRKIYPFIVFLIAILIICFICRQRSIVKPVSYISKAQAATITEVSRPSVTPTATMQEDRRITTLRSFFEDKCSPLASSAADFIEIADTYGLDWTLMPAISGIESNFGKRMPKGSNNPFGLGGGNLMRFPALYDSIEYEGKLLSEKYKLASNRAIGSIYCPSFECNQNWAVIVTNFSKEILN
ncbi:MAG: hypothetical protein ACR2LN_02475 [Candidatus Levyibacteriota bacterium]